MRICQWPSAEWSDLGFLLCAQRGGNHSVWVLRHIGFWLCQMTKINCCSVKHHCFVRGSAEFKNPARAFSVHHACRVWVFWKLWVCQEVSAAGWTCTAFFQGEVLPCSPSQSPEGRFGCDGEHQLPFMQSQQRVMLWEAHPAAPLFITLLEVLPSCCQVLNKNLADLGLVLCASVLLLWLTDGVSLGPKPSIPIFTQSPVTEDPCVCSFWRLTLPWQGGLLSWCY